MPDITQTVFKLVTELVKYQAKKVFGDGFINVLSSQLTDIAGESASEKVDAFLAQGSNAENLLMAFKDADDEFYRDGDDTQRQMIHDKPLAALESLEKLANKFPKTLDTDGLLEALRSQFASDWGNLTADEHLNSAKLYRTCLERSLAVRCNQTLPVIFAKLDRIESKQDKFLENQKADTERILEAIAETSRTTYTSFTISPPVGDFTGRENEINELKTKITQGALIVGISGSGGIGKTQFAYKLASEIKENFPGARLEIDLHGTSENPLSPENAMRIILSGFYEKLPDNENQLKGLYQKTFSTRKCLLLLDNAANAAQVRPLILPAPSAIIITSRTNFTLPNMSLVRLHELSEDESVTFLLDLCERTAQNAKDIAKLCGYLPLALRIAGTFLVEHRDWSPTEYMYRLKERRLESLKSEDDDPALDLESTIDLSYIQQSQNEKKLWRSLGVFASSFRREAAIAVWNVNEDEAHSLLSKFTRISLLEFDEVKGRYSLHDLLAEYAIKKMDDNETFSTHLLFAKHYEQILSDANQFYYAGGDNYKKGLDLFDSEFENINNAQTWLLQNKETNSEVLKLIALFAYRGMHILTFRLHPKEIIKRFEPVLSLAMQSGIPDFIAPFLIAIGSAHLALGETQPAFDHFTQAITISKIVANKQIYLYALTNLANLLYQIGKHNEALDYYKQALPFARELGEHQNEASINAGMGLIYEVFGDYQSAINFYQQALSLAHELGFRRQEAEWLRSLGNASASLGKLDEAFNFYKDSLSIAQDIKDKFSIEQSYLHFGALYNNLENYEKALDYYNKALEISNELEDRQGKAEAIVEIANVYYKNNSTEEASPRYQQALSIFREVNDMSGEARALASLGNISRRQENFSAAKQYYEQALELHKSMGELPHQALDLMNIGLMLSSLNNWKDAIMMFNRAVEISKQTQNEEIEITILLNTGLAYSEIGNYEMAVEYLVQALNKSKKSRNERLIATSYQDLAKVYTKMEDFRRAKESLEQSLPYLNSNFDQRNSTLRQINYLKTKIPQEVSNETSIQTIFMRHVTQEIISSAIHALRTGNTDEKECFFNEAVKMALDTKSPIEMQETGKVLQRILIGVKNPDMSNLPKELAQYIKEELER